MGNRQNTRLLTYCRPGYDDERSLRTCHHPRLRDNVHRPRPGERVPEPTDTVLYDANNPTTAEVLRDLRITP